MNEQQKQAITNFLSAVVSRTISVDKHTGCLVTWQVTRIEQAARLALRLGLKIDCTHNFLTTKTIRAFYGDCVFEVGSANVTAQCLSVRDTAIYQARIERETEAHDALLRLRDAFPELTTLTDAQIHRLASVIGLRWADYSQVPPASMEASRDLPSTT